MSVGPHMLRDPPVRWGEWEVGAVRPSGPDEDVAGADAWQLGGMPGGLPQASYLTPGRYAAQYRAIVDVLLGQQEHTLMGVAATDLPELVRAHLAGAGADPGLVDEPGFDLAARMMSLERWGVVDRFQDRALRDADFIRNLDRFQLTEIAAQLHRAVTGLGRDDATAAVATLAPGILTANLAVLCAGAASDPAEAANAWSIILNTHHAMARAAAGWQARLASALAGTPTVDKITVVQETLRRYVDMWGSGVDVHSETITRRVIELSAVPDPVWRAVAARTLGPNADERALTDLVGSYRQTLETLRSWFDGPDCQARRLRRQMRDTIGPLLRGQRTLAAVGGHMSRRAELLALAARVEAAPDDEAGWRMWCAATGLFSARHLPGAAPAPAGNPAASSWWQSETVPVEARLRRQGPRSTTGSPARLADNTGNRRAARATAEARQSEAAQTEAAVLARSGLRLSDWPPISDAETTLLLHFLTTMLRGVREESGARTATTGDGRWSLRTEPVPGGADAVVHTPAGRLVHPDLVLFIAGSLD